MRVVRFGEPGCERPGLLVEEGVIDLRKVLPLIPDVDKNFFEGRWLEKIMNVSEEVVDGPVRLGPPISPCGKIICVGRNYMGHVKEGKRDVPAIPLLFCKTSNALIGCRDSIMLPRSSKQVDWEAELAVIIGKQGKRIPRQQALDYVAGYAVMNDISARDVQFGDSQWYRGKSFDTFAPLGPALVTKDEAGDLGNLRITAKLNGEVMQDANTGQMIFPIPYLVEFISEDITLFPGDVIATGTPSGVGIFCDPPVLLKEGDEIVCEVETIGKIQNKVVTSV